MLIYDELEGYPGVTENQLNFFQQKGIWSAYGFMIAFCSCVNIEVLENIYKNFKPGKDYNSRCFKIINKHCLTSLECKEKNANKSSHQNIREALEQFVSKSEYSFLR